MDQQFESDAGHVSFDVDAIRQQIANRAKSMDLSK